MVEKTMSCGAHFNQKAGASDQSAFFSRAGGVDDGYDEDDDHDDHDDDDHDDDGDDDDDDDEFLGA